MLSQDYIKKSMPGRNRARANGYYHFHGGIPRRRSSYRPYCLPTPNETRAVRLCALIMIFILVLLVVLAIGSIWTKRCEQGQPCGNYCISWYETCLEK